VQPAADKNRPKAKGYLTNASHFFGLQTIGRTSLAPLARQASGYFPIGRGVITEDLGFKGLVKSPAGHAHRAGGLAAAQPLQPAMTGFEKVGESLATSPISWFSGFAKMPLRGTSPTRQPDRRHCE